MKPFDHRQELINMFRKYLDGTATPEENQFVETWYRSFEKESEVLDLHSEAEQQQLEDRMEQAIRQHSQVGQPDPLRKGLIRSIGFGRVAAAAVLILSLAGFWYYVTKTVKPLEQTGAGVINQEDFAPGGNRAVLTLSNGTQIALDSVSIGMLARQGNTVINKVEDGLVSYTRDGTQTSQDFNTITAPAGGKYSVVLPDGSRVWLNTESSITFPTAFSVDERSVKISGEVYFEIAKDPGRPFSVHVGSFQKVRVLGTHFNINAYRDEGDITTTLLEGSVEVLASARGARAVMLRPGEQAALSGSGKIRIHDNINTEEIIAWKNGMFQFENADIESVMRQFSRWYNVDVVYEGQLPSKTFSGKIDREVNASEALEILSFTGLNFRIETLPAGTKKGKIVVLPGSSRHEQIH